MLALAYQTVRIVVIRIKSRKQQSKPFYFTVGDRLLIQENIPLLGMGKLAILKSSALNAKLRTELCSVRSSENPFQIVKKYLMKPLKPEAKSKAREQTEVVLKVWKVSQEEVFGNHWSIVQWRSLVTSALSFISRKVTSCQSQLIVT